MKIIGSKYFNKEIYNIALTGIVESPYKHLLIVSDSFIISKFLDHYLEFSSADIVDFNIDEYINTQIQSLNIISHILQNKNNTINLSNITFEGKIWCIILLDIIHHFWIMCDRNERSSFDWFRICGADNEIQKYQEIKISLVDQLQYLPEILKRMSNNIISVTNDSNSICIKKLFTKSEKDVEYHITALTPSRASIRFFLFHFFGFQLFSEERQDTVRIWTILDPGKYIEEISYNDKKIIKRQWWQYDIIASVLEWNNTLGLLSTGSGKSITFLLSTMLLYWASIIIAPLKSLIDDQYDNLSRKFYLDGLTGRIHSGMTDNEREEVMNWIVLWNYKFIYCAPERLQIKTFIDKMSDWIQSKYIRNFIVDEAHCLSERWHDFRTAYLNIWVVKETIYGNESFQIPLLALTATASDQVRKDIYDYLDISYVVEESSLNRPNLSFEIITVNNQQDKPIVIKNLLDEKLDWVLWNVAWLNNERYNPIFNKGDDEKFSNTWIVFTIYWPIGRKKSKDSIAQSAEGMQLFLSDKLEDKHSVSLYMSEKPKYKANLCPNCDCIDFVKSKRNKKKEKSYLYFNNITDSFEDIDYWLYDKLKNKNFYTIVEKNSEFLACNNASCQHIFTDNEIKTVDIEYLPATEQNQNREITKTWIQKAFKDWNLATLIATKGFGMWIDKSNIRYVIHATLSWSLESYYQEVWRSGRDKKHSHCVLLFNWPTKSCLEKCSETDEHGDVKFTKPLPCFKSAGDMQFNKCPKWLSSMCDIARQYKMLASPVTLSIPKNWKDTFWEQVYLHSYLDCGYDDLNDDNIKVIITVKKNKIQVQRSRNSLLHENAQTWLTHELMDFWLLVLFYKNYIISRKENITQQNSRDDDNEVKNTEMCIYRFMNLWLIKQYFKQYQNNQVTYSIIYRDDINQSDLIFKKYLENKLWISWNAIEDAMNACEISYPNVYIRLTSYWNNEIYKNIWALCYWVYATITEQRKERLNNLYKAIDRSSIVQETQNDNDNEWDHSEKNNRSCFKIEIMRRLSGYRQEDEKKCNFCSGCVPDTSKFSVTQWLLKSDIEIVEHNQLIKKQYSGLQLSKEEKYKLKEYQVSELSLIQLDNLYGKISQNDISTFPEILAIMENNSINISAKLEKSLEANPYHMWYRFLRIYFWETKEKITSFINELWIGEHLNLSLQIGSFVANNEFSQEIKDKLLSNNWVKLWYYQEKFSISADNVSKISILHSLNKRILSS
jgi:superfamily II DNA/RNA helicase